MSDAGFPQPTEQHAWLMNHVGTWTVEMFAVMPGGPELKFFTYIYRRA